jgi:hypothetical protein
MRRALILMLLLTPLAGCGITDTTTSSSSSPVTATTGTSAATVTAASASRTIAPPPCGYRTFRDGAIAPSPACAPGAIDAHAAAHPTQTICRRGYAARARPSEQHGERIKLALLDRYRATEPSASYVLDQLVAVEDGGSPTDRRNMWPQPIAQAKQKDAIEDYLRLEICAGKVTVQRAARVLEGDWLAADTEHH